MRDQLSKARYLGQRPGDGVSGLAWCGLHVADLVLPGLQYGPQEPGNVPALCRLDELVGMGQHKFCAVTALDVTQQRLADPNFEADVDWLLCHVRSLPLLRPWHAARAALS